MPAKNAIPTPLLSEPKSSSNKVLSLLGLSETVAACSCVGAGETNSVAAAAQAAATTIFRFGDLTLPLMFLSMRVEAYDDEPIPSASSHILPQPARSARALQFGR